MGGYCTPRDVSEYLVTRWRECGLLSLVSLVTNWYVKEAWLVALKVTEYFSLQRRLSSFLIRIVPHTYSGNYSLSVTNKIKVSRLKFKFAIMA